MQFLVFRPALASARDPSRSIAQTAQRDSAVADGHNHDLGLCEFMAVSAFGVSVRSFSLQDLRQTPFFGFDCDSLRASWAKGREPSGPAMLETHPLFYGLSAFGKTILVVSRQFQDFFWPVHSIGSEENKMCQLFED